jgi:5'-3' exonuclease
VIVHLVDGTYELFRSYFGAPAATSPAGREVGATRGLMRSLLGLLTQPDVTHVGVAYDHVIESFRNGLYDGYKTSAGVPRELLAQFELAERATHALGLVVWPMVEFEADDALATAAARFEEEAEVEQVVICTPDKDLAQCVTDPRVVQLDRRQRRLFDEAAVREKFGVSPASIPDWLALVGDNADGFPGLPGWGAKSAAAVLARYGHIEEIPVDATTWDVPVRGATKLSATLGDGQREAMLFRDLATLRADAPVGAVDDWRWRGPRPELEQFSERFGAPELLARARKAAEGREP